MMRELSFSEAIFEAISEEMDRDERVFYMGTDVPPSGIGPLGELREKYPERVRLAPITEGTNAGAAIGAAAVGLRPVVNFLLCNFAFGAFDQIANHAACFHYMYGGQASLPIVFRQTVGAGRGSAAQHSSTVYSIYMNIAGLKIVVPSCAYDAKGLLKSAIRDGNPVLFFEDNMLGTVKEAVPKEEYLVPLGSAAVRREGSDVTVVALASLVSIALDLAGQFAGEGVEIEVLDPRSLVPFDDEAFHRSVRKTGRLVILDRSNRTASAAAEIAARACEDWQTFKSLRAPIQRVCTSDTPVPYSAPLEDYILPNREKARAAIQRLLM